WKEIEAGFRGSLLLKLGAIFSVVGSLGNLGAELLGGGDGPAQAATTVAWVLYITGLWLFAGGFILIGTQLTMAKFSIVVGIFHAVQGVFLLILLFTFTQLPFPPISMTVGRLIAILILVFLERHLLPRRTRSILIWATGLQLTKATARALGIMSDFAAPIGPLVDTVFLIFLAAALMQLSVFARSEEDRWARQIFEAGHADFTDFNNPQHVWNKPNSNRKKQK
ncbi:MAG: hypothetical protein ACI9UQ_002292, partial [Candidatus Krumholzibacteriia bacterium]